jgi:hypothetical protein
MGSDPFFYWYVGAWGAGCLVAVAMVLSNVSAYSFTSRDYVRFLASRKGRGATFSFQEPGWPGVAPGADFGRLIWIALPFMAIATASVVYFLLP